MSLIKVNELASLDGAGDPRVNASTGIKIPASAEVSLEGSFRDSTGSVGLSNQYLVSNGSEVVWQSLPQDINVTSDVTFNNVTVSGDITIAGTANFTLNAFTTSDLVEGGNLYYTDVRARNALSASVSGSGDGSLSYNNATGNFTYSGPTNIDYRSAFGAVTFTDSEVRFGALNYNQVSGDFTYTGITDTEIKNIFSSESNEGSPTSLGSFGYDPLQGQFSYLGPTEEVIKNLFSAGGDLVYDVVAGEFSVNLGAVSPTLIYGQINTSSTTDVSSYDSSIQNLYVNNAAYQLAPVTEITVLNDVATVLATSHTFIAGDRVKLSDTGDAHLDGIYTVLTSNAGPLGITDTPGTSFTIATANVADQTLNPASAEVKRVSVFTGDLVVDGSINVNGSKIGLSDLFVGTSLIRLNSDLPDDQNPAFDGTDDAIIEVNRGAQPDTALRWSELARRWQFSNDGINYNNILLPSETDFGGAEEFGASGDAERYDVLSVSNNVVGANTFKVLEVPDITKFRQNHRVKVFGLSKTQNLSAENPQPALGNINGVSASYETAGFGTADKNYYAYAIAQVDLNTGDVSPARVQSDAPALNRNVDDLNEANYNIINVIRDGGGDKGILLYRGIFNNDGTGAAAQNAIDNFNDNSTEFKLIAVIGPKYFGSGDTSYTFNDYGSYDVVVNSDRNIDGSFGPDEVHIPHTAPIQARQGWITAGIRPGGIDEGASTIEIDVPALYEDNDINNIFLYHDDTIPLQNAINDAKDTGRNFLVIPGGTYLVTQLQVPDKFTLKGLADATVLHRQYWSTEYITGVDYLNGNTPRPDRDSVRSSLIVGENYDGSLTSPLGMVDVFFGDIILDGAVKYQILNSPDDKNNDANDSVINGVNSQFLRLSNVKVRKSAGPALFAAGCENLTIDSCTFFDGGDSERFQTPVLIADEGDTTIVTGCVFRDFPGPLDFTSTNVLSVNACTIRNCASGIRIYGSSKTDVLNNLILGPADEYIPVPDFYDSDFNSVNFPIAIGIDNKMPTFQYVLTGVGYDLRANNTIKRVEVYRATRDVNGQEVVDLTSPITNGGNDWFQDVDVLAEGENDPTKADPSIGQVRFGISAADTNQLELQYPTGLDAYNIYRAVGIDYNAPVGDDLNAVLGTGELSGTTYVVNCNETAHNAVIVGYYIKLIGHSYAPAPAPTFGERIWRVAAKTNLGGGDYQLSLESWEENASGDIKSSVSEGNTLSTVGPEPTPGGGYFRIRNKFVMARGILTVSV